MPGSSLMHFVILVAALWEPSPTCTLSKIGPKLHSFMLLEMRYEIPCHLTLLKMCRSLLKLFKKPKLAKISIKIQISACFPTVHCESWHRAGGSGSLSGNWYFKPFSAYVILQLHVCVSILSSDTLYCNYMWVSSYWVLIGWSALVDCIDNPGPGGRIIVSWYLC